MIEFGPAVCGSLEEASRREWLVADGLGGYAMGTVAGLRTRRYHGLLISAQRPPIGRMLGLAALDAVVVMGDRRVRLATHEWSSGIIDPTGHRFLESFDLADGLPRWRYRIGAVVIERELAMVYGRPAVGLVHRLVAAPGPVEIELAALCAWRDVHGQRYSGDIRHEVVDGGFQLEGALRLAGPGYTTDGAGWFTGVRYAVEAERGLIDTEDLFCGGTFDALLQPGQAAEVTAWTGDLAAAPPAATDIVAKARTRAREVVFRGNPTDDTDRRLLLAADALVVGGPTIVAGYPWFGDWSRDTMTSYEGLLLETGRADEGRRLLERAAGSLSEGMLANTADVGGTPEYNTVDGTLWFVHAVGRHIDRTGDDDLAAALMPQLREIVDRHVAGTRFGIRADADGLITQGVEGWALTWMDARVDGRPITQRAGKPVEVNALWVNALGVIAGLAERVGQDAAWIRGLEAEATASFARHFVRPDGLGLFDVVDGPFGQDASIRPNQLLAVSLPFAPLREPSAVAVCAERLLTPVGLRSLEPGAPGYRGAHRGGVAERDGAYHQGTVWPWLVGPLVDASLRTGGDPAGLTAGLERHTGEYGLLSVSETADGDAPHGATGCPFQAWSVAEVLRARRTVARRV